MVRRSTHEMIQKLRRKLRLHQVHPLARKFIVSVVGGVCLLAGVVMIFLPGPAFVFIPLGLLILASEFKWAEQWAGNILEMIRKLRSKWRLWRKRRARAATLKS